LATPSSEHDLAADSRWELAQRVAHSRDFQKAPRLRDFFLYVCKEAILGHADLLTEHQIGCAVFGRRPDYSPADDSIVRVQARQLRLRLAEYFRSQGAAENVVIRIPKGGYVPVFSEGGAPAEDESASETAVPPPVGWPAWPAAVQLGLAAMAIVLLISCAALLLQNRGLKTAAPGTDPGQKSWLLAEMFEGARTTNVICGDPAFGSIQGMLNRALSLEDYLRPGYPESIMPPGLAPQYAHAFRAISGYPLSSFTQVMMAERLGRLSQRFNWRYLLRHSRDVTTRDLAQGNQILLGSRMSNPWVSLFEKGLVFQSEWDPQNEVVFFRNTSPLNGERSIYASAGPNGIPGSAFAVVALLTGPQPAAQDSRVLILEGTKGEATEAAWDLVTDPDRMRERLSSAGFDVAKIRERRNFEILLETKALGGSHGEVVVRSVRPH
jgi:hypothetical protein